MDFHARDGLTRSADEALGVFLASVCGCVSVDAGRSNSDASNNWANAAAIACICAQLYSYGTALEASNETAHGTAHGTTNRTAYGTTFGTTLGATLGATNGATNRATHESYGAAVWTTQQPAHGAAQFPSKSATKLTTHW